ncbi:hypothetical protein SUGI_0812930 [Cryptomeria japonica]|nr:hypothetical protein SUGI_0812930 [Cryptomeria japonica]
MDVAKQGSVEIERFAGRLFNTSNNTVGRMDMKCNKCQKSCNKSVIITDGKNKNCKCKCAKPRPPPSCRPRCKPKCPPPCQQSCRPPSPPPYRPPCQQSCRPPSPPPCRQSCPQACPPPCYSPCGPPDEVWLVWKEEDHSSYHYC